jgi:hypothetical protein
MFLTQVQVQQDLARPGVLERFVPDAEDASLLRSCFAGAPQFAGTFIGCKGNGSTHAIAHTQAFRSCISVKECFAAAEIRCADEPEDHVSATVPH